MGKEKQAFAYDDAFRTMTVECDDIVLPFVNMMFNESYDSTAKIVRRGNEHYIERQDAEEDKRITDSFFEIEFKNNVKKYHIECESSAYDGSVLIRLFEYDAQIALDDGSYNKECLRANFPNSGLLILRSRNEKPKELTVEINTPGGKVSYPVKVMCESDYDIDMIFEKKLYFLIPFYIFNYEKRLNEINKQGDEYNEFAKLYQSIHDRVNEAAEKGELSVFTKNVIMESTERVTAKFAKKQKRIVEKVGDIMGGRVMDLEIIRVKHAAEELGWKEGMKEGIQKGMQEGVGESIVKLAEYNMSKDSSLSREDAIAQATAILA